MAHGAHFYASNVYGLQSTFRLIYTPYFWL